MDLWFIYVVWRNLGGSEGWEPIGYFQKLEDARKALIDDINKWTVPVSWRITPETVK